ncbi:MAG: DUF3455 domain-containing protein [Janthinobacterium lividum]
MIRSLFPIAALALFCISGSQTGSAQARPTPTLPIPLSVGNNVILLEAKAIGVQIYICKVKHSNTLKSGDAPQAYEWVFKAPEADLYAPDGSKIGRHFAGPTWEATDGSKVVGSLLGSAVSPGSIPWLLLSAKSTAGRGSFSKVTYVERVFTSGGAAPLSGADAAHVGTEVRVPYTATYIFYRK